jgi:hypothetical protein
MIHHIKNSIFILKSTLTNKLINKEIEEICLLKDKQWKFGLKSQLKWFKNNIKKNDLHSLFYIKSKLVGYTLLGKRTCKIENLNKKTQYLLLDTLVIDKKYRNAKLSNILMNFNNTIIKQSGISSFLICKDKLISFYMKYDWKKLNKRSFITADYALSSNGMIFNKLNFDKKYIFYIKK